MQEIDKNLKHKLNNLLFAIMGNAQILKNESLVKDEGKNILNDLIHSSIKMKDVLTSTPKVKASNQNDLEVFKDKKCILIIEDQKVVRNLTERILEKEGYFIFKSSSGEQGIELYERYKKYISCVVLDHGMPYMGGSLVYAKLKALNSNVKVVIMSGYDQFQISKQYDNSVSSFLEKPFEKEELAESVHNAISKAKYLDRKIA